MAAESVLAEIDREHEELAGRLTELDRLLACLRGDGGCYVCDAAAVCCTNAIQEFCERLLEFMLEHFQREESAMQSIQAGNPRTKSYFDAHREHHADLSQSLADAIRGGALPAAAYQDLRRIVCDWLETHLSQHDAVLAQALRAEGVPLTA